MNGESGKVAVFGRGGHGREVAWLLAAHERFRVACFVVDDGELPRVVNNVPVWSWNEYVTDKPCSSIVVAIGDVHDRRDVVARCREAGLVFPFLVDSSVRLSDFVRMGEGSVICCGTVLTVNITIGRHVHINRCCSISHDVRIGDFTTLSPGVNVSGHVEIGSNVFIGAGATIINGSRSAPLYVADGSTIGAGACVTRSIRKTGVYKGVPARAVVPSTRSIEP